MVLVVKNLPANVGDIREHEFDPWVRKIPWRRTWQPTPVFLPGKSMDGGAWWATVHGVAKSQTRLSDFTSLISNGEEQTEMSISCRIF